MVRYTGLMVMYTGTSLPFTVTGPEDGEGTSKLLEVVMVYVYDPLVKERL